MNNVLRTRGDPTPPLSISGLALPANPAQLLRNPNYQIGHPQSDEKVRMEYSQPANLERVRSWVTGCNHHPIGEPSLRLSQIDQLMIATLSGRSLGFPHHRPITNQDPRQLNFINKIHHPTFAAIRITTPCPRPIGGVYYRIYFFVCSRASNSQIDVR